MKHTDYSLIANNYDNNYLRHLIPKDNLIEKLYSSNNNSLRILDLACGTGNYIQQQMKFYNDYNIEWIGVDKSNAMLSLAIKKRLNANFINCDAHSLPFENNSFDFIKNRFAFHHFNDKTKVLLEIYRILKKGGVLSIYNICYEYMKNPWIYRYFPSAFDIDKERFFSANELFEHLKGYGFTVDSNVNVQLKEYTYEEIIKEVKNKDMSQLNIISEKEYTDGLNRINSDSLINNKFIGDIAFLNFTCVK